MEYLKNHKIQVIITLFLLAALPLGLVLVQRQQTLKSKANLQVYNAFNVASGEPGKYVSCSGNVCETNTLNITIFVRDLQALNIQGQQASQQCVWQSAPLRCTGCGVASIVEQESCTQEIRVTADDVVSEECNLPEWCGSYVTQNTTERPPEQTPEPSVEPSPEPQGEPQPVCEEKSYCDDNLGLRVFWNTCQGTPVKEAEFDPECVPAEQLALNLRLRQEEQAQAQTQDLAKQLEQREQARIEAKKAETANIPQNVANFVGGLPGGVWGGISSLWESQQQKPPEKNILEKIGDNRMILLKLAQSFAEQGRREQEIYNQKVTPECKAYLQSSYASGGVFFYQRDSPCAYLEGQKLKTAEEAAAEAEKVVLESNDLKVGLATLQVNLDISEEKRNLTFCLFLVLCPSIEIGLPTDARVTMADLMRKNQVVELAEKLDLDLSLAPNEWDPAKREYFFKVIARGDINPAKALAEFLVPVTALENLQVSKSICEKKYQGNCIVSSDNILGIVNMSDQDIEQANQIAQQLYPQLNPASGEKVKEYARILYSDPAIADQYLSDAAKVKYDRKIAQSLGVSPEELLNIKNTFKVYGQVGDHIRNNTSAGKLFQQDQNTVALEGSIAVVTILPVADLAMEGLILGVRKVTPKVLSILIRDYGDDVARKIARDVESVAERGGKSMSAAEAASVRKAEEALAKSTDGEVLLAATPAQSFDNLVRSGGVDNEAAAALRQIRDDPNLEQTAAQGLKAAHNGAGKLDDVVVVIPDSNAGFVTPDTPTGNPFQAVADAVDDLVKPPEAPVTTVRQLADVADNLDGAEARLLGEAPPPPNPAAEMLTNAAQVLGIEPRELKVVSGDPNLGTMRLAKDQPSPFKFTDSPETSVTVGGRTYSIGDKYLEADGRAIIPIRLDDGTVTMVYLSSSEKNFKWYVGIDLDNFGGLILKSNQGKEIMDVPLDLDRAIKEALSNKKVELVGQYSSLYSFQIGEFHDVLQSLGFIRHGRSENVSGIMDNFLNRLGVTQREITTEDARKIAKSIDFGRPVDIVHNRALNAIDVYYQGYAPHGVPQQIRYSYDLNVSGGRFNPEHAVDFTIRPIDDQLAVYKPGYEAGLGKGVPSLARYGADIEADAGWQEISRLGRESNFGKTIDQLSHGYTKQPSEVEISRFIEEMKPAVGLAPCPIFSLIPQAFAQGAGVGLNPCPKNPFAALARNAQNTGRRIGDTVGDWVDNFRGIFRRGGKEEVGISIPQYLQGKTRILGDETFYHGTTVEDLKIEKNFQGVSPAPEEGSQTLGYGFYTTTNKEAADSYSKVRQMSAEAIPHTVSFKTKGARMLDFRDPNNLTQNLPVDLEFARKWQSYIEQIHGQRLPPQDNIEKILLDIEEDYLKKLEGFVQGGQEFNLRQMLDTNQGFAPRWGEDFAQFMKDQGYDGLIYNEGGEAITKTGGAVSRGAESAVVDTEEGASYVFFNLARVQQVDSRSIFEQVGGTLQNWFNAILNIGKKQSLSWEVVVV